LNRILLDSIVLIAIGGRYWWQEFYYHTVRQGEESYSIIGGWGQARARRSAPRLFFRSPAFTVPRRLRLTIRNGSPRFYDDDPLPLLLRHRLPLLPPAPLQALLLLL
jgi:hypothetical protein